MWNWMKSKEEKKDYHEYHNAFQMENVLWFSWAGISLVNGI